MNDKNINKAIIPESKLGSYCNLKPKVIPHSIMTEFIVAILNTVLWFLFITQRSAATESGRLK